MSRQELDILLARHLDGELSADQAERLRCLLRENPSAVDRLARLGRDHWLLGELLGAGGSVPAGSAAVSSGIGERARRVIRSLSTVLQHPGGQFAAAAMIVILLPLVTFMLTQIRWSVLEGPVDVIAESEPAAMLADQSDDAEWTGEHASLSPGDQLEPGWLTLTGGRASIRFHSGAEVELRAPAKFGINHPMRAHLRRGALAAHVPKEAQGFTVGAPGVAIVDLGTRFELAVNERGARVQVQRGQVRMDSESGEQRTVGARQAVAADPAGRMRSVRYEPMRPDRSAEARIEYVGKRLGIGGALRDPSVAKPLDADGDGVLGSAGYLLPFLDEEAGKQRGLSGRAFDHEAAVRLPEPIARIRPAPHAASAGDFGYLPIATPGPLAGDAGRVESGVLAAQDYNRANQRRTLARITFGQPLDGRPLRMGVYVNNVPHRRNVPAAIRLRGSGADTGPVEIDRGEARRGDVYLFDLAGFQAGNTLTIELTNAPDSRRPNGQWAHQTIGGLTFDRAPQNAAPGKESTP